MSCVYKSREHYLIFKGYFQHFVAAVEIKFDLGSAAFETAFLTVTQF